MSKISREGYEQIKVIKKRIDSMYDKLERKKFLMRLKMSLRLLV